MTEYVCGLDAATQEKARRELSEDALTRLEALADIRQWLATMPHIKCPTDATVLLRYLRASKFNIDKAKSRLSNHMTLHAKLPDWFTQVDTHDPKILAVLDSLHVMYLPGVDRDNQKVVLYRMGSFDPDTKDYDKAAIMRTFTALFQYEIMQEENQVNGFVYLLDVSNFTLKQQLYWTPADIVIIAKLWQNALPCRFKAFHFYNVGPVFEVLLRILMPFLSEKFRQRIKIHHSLSTVHEYVPQEILPDEYQPEDYTGPSAGSMQPLLAGMKAELMRTEIRASILESTGTSYGIDERQRSKPASRWQRMMSWAQGTDQEQKKHLYDQLRADVESM